MPTSAPPRPRGRYAPTAGFAPQVDAGVSPFAALAATPERASSLGGTLDSDLAAFAAASGNGAWPNLPRAQVATRLTEIVRDPTKINQAGLNACGSATAMYLFAKRRVEEFARFAMTLYDRGVADFGTVRVSGAGLTQKDPARMSWPPGNAPQLLDWMLLSATLRGTGTLLHFSGEPSDDLSGITLPGDLENWLEKGVRYSHVSNEANKFLTKGLSHLKALSPSPGEDIVVLINADVVPPRSTSAGIIGDIGNWLTRQVTDEFPNHYFVLERPIDVQGAMIVATGWTWGGSGHKFSGNVFDWMKGYYGALKAKV